MLALRMFALRMFYFRMFYFWMSRLSMFSLWITSQIMNRFANLVLGMCTMSPVIMLRTTEVPVGILKQANLSYLALCGMNRVPDHWLRGRILGTSRYRRDEKEACKKQRGFFEEWGCFHSAKVRTNLRMFQVHSVSSWQSQYLLESVPVIGLIIA